MRPLLAVLEQSAIVGKAGLRPRQFLGVPAILQVRPGVLRLRRARADVPRVDAIGVDIGGRIQWMVKMVLMHVLMCLCWWCCYKNM